MRCRDKDSDDPSAARCSVPHILWLECRQCGPATAVSVIPHLAAMSKSRFQTRYELMTDRGQVHVRTRPSGFRLYKAGPL